ncbi:MAG: hypothetical protein ACON42_08945 [Flavobacteriaceae bacterium]
MNRFKSLLIAVVLMAFVVSSLKACKKDSSDPCLDRVREDFQLVP